MKCNTGLRWIRWWVLRWVLRWISKRVFQENKARQMFQKTNIPPPIRTYTCAYQDVRNVRFSENLACFVFLKHSFWDPPFCPNQGVRNVRFSKNLACFVFLKHPFWDSLFCLITDELTKQGLSSSLSDIIENFSNRYQKCYCKYMRNIILWFYSDYLFIYLFTLFKVDRMVVLTN